MPNSVITRFAPSPTGFLHIGGARTALFNWLYAKHTGGKFLLRIEDTDQKRSTDDAIDAIYEGLSWLGLDWDDEALSQHARLKRHQAVAQDLLSNGLAYKCYCSPEELQDMRQIAKAEGRTRLYDGRWRDRDPSDAPTGVEPVIRLKTPLQGETVIGDVIQGEVRVSNEQLDDIVLLRADGSPTYMLAVVVDDHDMKISHVIRGDDHLTNAFRQVQIYNALNWNLPVFAHMPLLHGTDGAKLSKRHGALGVEAYRSMGILPEAMNNYLLRLGWSHGDDEIISQDHAIRWFDVKDVGRAASRFDMEKLTSVNGYYIRHADVDYLVSLILPIIQKNFKGKLADQGVDRLKNGMVSLRERAKNILELAENATFYALPRPISYDAKATKLLAGSAVAVLEELRSAFLNLQDWVQTELEIVVNDHALATEAKLGKIAQPLRAAVTGRTVSPGIFEILEILGKDEVLGRLDDAIEAHTT
ncbi:MAG: glutamate--tRNA ligase [Rhodospirillaceae bacterium]|nr:glutamate--tRNA ligase [Rhodospirillaceae bacterium]